MRSRRARMIHSTFMIHILLLYFGLTSIGQTTSSIEDIIERIKFNPSNSDLLHQLGQVIQQTTSEKEKTHGIAVYCLGYLLLGNYDLAQSGINILNQKYPGSQYTALVTFDNLSHTCGNCGGLGTVQKQCTKCKGSGTCIACNGAGSMQLISSTARCPACGGTGRCKDCNGTGQVQGKCTQCGGRGRCFDRIKAQDTYTALLNERSHEQKIKLEEQQKQKRLDIELALAKAQQADRERTLLESERKLLEEKRKQAEVEKENADRRPTAEHVDAQQHNTSSKQQTHAANNEPSNNNKQEESTRAAHILALRTLVKSAEPKVADFQRVLIDPASYTGKILKSTGYMVDVSSGPPYWVRISPTLKDAHHDMNDGHFPGHIFLPNDQQLYDKVARVYQAVGRGGRIKFVYGLLGMDNFDRVLFNVDLP